MPLDREDRALIPVADATRLVAYNPAYAMPEMEPEAPTLPLSHYLWILKRHRWKIVAFVVACVAASVAISSRITPIYESTATVDIDRQSPNAVIGQEATRPSSVQDTDQFLATQIKLIQSDSVLRPVATKYHLLDHEAQTVKGEEPAAASSAVPASEAPVMLSRLRVVRPPSTYLLLISYRSPDPKLAAEVSNAVAGSYLEHTYNIRIRSSASLSNFMEKQLDELRAKMEHSSQALSQFEREMNVINPEEKTNILSSRLLQLNTEYTNAQSERMRKEAAFQSVKTGQPEAAQASQQGEDLRRLGEKLNETQQHFAEVKEHFGPNHPEHRKAAAQVAEVQRQMERTRTGIGQRVEIEFRESANRETMLQRAVAETKAEFDRVNSRSFQYQALKREAESDKRLYDELVRKIKEAGINAGFQNSAIRIADPARPPRRPVFPNVRLNAMLALVFSSILAVGAALLSDVLDNTIRDPEQVARTLNTEVIGSLPSVKNWRGRWAEITAGAPTQALVKASDADQAITGYEESIRTLRNSILLTDFDRRVRSLLVTSASPSEGKSTMAVHLAVAHAEQQHKTLLIDGDLRRPSVHRRFNLSTAQGLSNVLTAESAWKDLLVQPPGLPHLDILPAGPPSRRASDLIGRGLAEILAEASAEYDLVILDGPPMLGFAEPLQMATAVDGVVVVTRAGQTNRKAVGNVINTLKRLRATVLGVVLNEVHQEMSDAYYYYGHYGKYYGANSNA